MTYKRRKSFQNTNLSQRDNKSREQKRIQIKRQKGNQPFATKNSYETSCRGMVDFPTEYIQYIKDTYPERSYLGKPEYKWKHCNAIFWFNERNKCATKCNNPEVIYSNCCKNGKIKIPKFREPPTYLKSLLNPSGGKICRHFLEKIRQYNSLFAFTSMGGTI